VGGNLLEEENTVEILQGVPRGGEGRVYPLRTSSQLQQISICNKYADVSDDACQKIAQGAKANKVEIYVCSILKGTRGGVSIASSAIRYKTAKKCLLAR